jgi:hypothetical protein
MLNIIEISKINNRDPGGIISRLCKYNYIPNRTSARYTKIVIYINKLYHLVKVEKENKEEKQEQNIKVNNNDNILISINKCYYIELQNDVKEMKK